MIMLDGCGHSYDILSCYCKCGLLYVFVMYWCVVFVYLICAQKIYVVNK